MKTKKVQSPDTRIEAEGEATRAMLDVSERTITDRATTLFVDRIGKEAVRTMVVVEDQTMADTRRHQIHVRHHSCKSPAHASYSIQ